jgi:hypothetical protein
MEVKDTGVMHDQYRDYESVPSQEDDPEKMAGIQNDIKRLN